MDVMSQEDFLDRLQTIFDEYESFVINDAQFNALVRVLLAHYFYPNKQG